MRALSLHEPYATLVAIGAKKWETRGRRTHVRGLVAIHAAKTRQRLHLRFQRPFFDALEGVLFDELPFGCVIAVADITDCLTSTGWLRHYCKTPTNPGADREYCFGDYSPGRFAWKLENVRKLRNPVPCIGRQGFWTLDLLTEDRIDAELP